LNLLFAPGGAASVGRNSRVDTRLERPGNGVREKGGLAIVRGPISRSRTYPRVVELPLASTCAITSKPVAGRPLSVRSGRNSLLSLSHLHGAPLVELAPVPAALAIQSPDPQDTQIR